MLRLLRFFTSVRRFWINNGRSNASWKTSDAIEEVETLPFKDLLTSPLWQSKFGLEHYLSPETLLQKYVKPEVPKEPETFDYLGDG